LLRKLPSKSSLSLYETRFRLVSTCFPSNKAQSLAPACIFPPTTFETKLSCTSCQMKVESLMLLSRNGSTLLLWHLLVSDSRRHCQCRYLHSILMLRRSVMRNHSFLVLISNKQKDLVGSFRSGKVCIGQNAGFICFNPRCKTSNVCSVQQYACVVFDYKHTSSPGALYHDLCKQNGLC
jgi:hypothetical protein